MKDIKRSICRWCNARCRVLVYVQNNHLLKVEDDPDRPMQTWPPTKACVRRQAAKEWFYHPDHLKYPLKRVGERGEGKWQRISWDQAFDEIAAKLAKIKQMHGAEFVAHTSGTGRTADEFRSRFFNLFGSPNQCGQATICHGPRAVMFKALLGWWPYSGANPESKCYILWGREPSQSWATIWYHIRNCKEEGKKLIVVDPRRAESAAISDIHLQVRPGTDCALAMGMINIIINEGLYDKECVRHNKRGPVLRKTAMKKGTT